MANHIIFFAIGLKGSLAGEGEGKVIPLVKLTYCRYLDARGMAG